MESPTEIAPTTTRDFIRKELVGRKQNIDAVLEEIFRLLSKNKIGCIDYNKYGRHDGDGFLKVTDEFVDSFCIFVPVPDYRVHKGRYTEVGTQNCSLVALLKRCGLAKATVKAVDFQPLQHVPKSWIIPCSDPSKVTEKTRYFKQVC